MTHQYTLETCHLLYLACQEARIWFSDHLQEQPNTLMTLTRLLDAERAALAESGPDPESEALSRMRARKYAGKRGDEA